MPKVTDPAICHSSVDFLSSPFTGLFITKEGCHKHNAREPSQRSLYPKWSCQLHGLHRAALVTGPDSWPGGSGGLAYWCDLCCPSPLQVITAFSFPSHLQQLTFPSGKRESPYQKKVRAPDLPTSILGFWKRINKIIFSKYVRLLGGVMKGLFICFAFEVCLVR